MNKRIKAVIPMNPIKKAKKFVVARKGWRRPTTDLFVSG